MKKITAFIASAMLLALGSQAQALPTASNTAPQPFLVAKATLDPEIAKLEKSFKADPQDINKQTAYSTAVTQAMQKMQVQGRSNDAISLGERAAKLIPQNVTLMHLLGTCYLDRFCFGQDTKDYEKAKSAWSKLVEAHPNSPDATLLWGLKCYENGNYAAALQHFQRAFNARQSDPYTLAFVGMTLSKLNNHQQAVQGLGMAYNKLKTNPAFLATQAAELRAVGQTGEADKRLSEANKYKHPQKPLSTLMELFPTQSAPAAPTISPATATSPATAAAPTGATVATPRTTAPVAVAKPTGTTTTSTATPKVATPASTAVATPSSPTSTPASAATPPTGASAPKQPVPQASASPNPTVAGSANADKNTTKTAVISTSPLPYRGLTPFPGLTPKPLEEVVTVNMQTDAGEIVIEVYPQAAPNAAQRFIELVKSGFYNNTPFFRVITQPQPFVAQFGINWRSGHKEWKDRLFNDDPSLFQLAPATLAFAKAGKNINSTQVFINYGDNNFLRGQGFTTFARIVKGYDIAKKFRPVGDPNMGLNQGQLWSDGQSYLAGLKQKPNMILQATVR